MAVAQRALVAPSRHGEGTDGDWPGWPAEVAVRLAATRLPRLMAAVMAVLLLLHLAAAVSTYVLGVDTAFGLIPLVRVHGEGTIPAWWSSLTLLLVSGLLLLTSRVERVASRAARPWVVLAGIFAVLALDEAVGFHELTTEPLRDALDTGGLLHLAWVVPAMVAVGAFALAHLRFLATLPRSLAVAFVVAGGCFVGGAIGMEMVDGAYLAANGDTPDFGYELLTGIEEGLEMASVLLLVRALIHYVVERTSALLVTVD